MTLWICLYLPTHALDISFPKWQAEHTVAAVMAQDRILQCTPQASAQGIAVGQRAGTARARAPHLLLATDQPQARHEDLQRLALAMLKYTPNVAFIETDAIVLDVAASLQLFKGPARLSRLIRSDLQSMGFRAQLSMAPSALGAWILASQAPARHRRRIRLTHLATALDALPVHALPAARPYVSWLEGIACNTLAQLRKLPRQGLQQRSSPLLVDALDKAYGLSVEHLSPFQAPPQFEQRIDLVERIEHSSAVLALSEHLVHPLCGWLHDKLVATQQLTLLLHHEKGRHARPPTELTLRFSAPCWMPDDFQRVLHERLQTMELPAPVIALELRVQHVCPRPSHSESLFADARQAASQEYRLLDLLRARLGAECIRQVQPHPDYRPEHANIWQPCEAALEPIPPQQLPPQLAFQTRPFWLLRPALALSTQRNRPVYQGRSLRLISGPERLETGWWQEGGHEQRDYFVAQAPEGERYWLYRQHAGSGSGWFLQGFFG